jgi:hypothetical protein
MQYRTRLFYFGCVPARVGAATIILLRINPMVSGISIFGCITILMTLGFIINHVRHKQNGFFGGRAWWHEFRKFHAVIWLAVSMLLFLDIHFAGILIIYDLLPGLIDVCRGVNL